jgi:uracil phosphoribosyltransferase
MKAVEVLMEHGVPQERIVFINLVRNVSSSLWGIGMIYSCKQIAAPEGLKTFYSRFPHVKVVTGWIDEGLNDKAYIIPGLGDFGERRWEALFSALSPFY